MSFVKNYYPILLESLLFVCLLSLFEYIMYYIILAPDNKTIIQSKVDDDVKKALNFETDFNNPVNLKKTLESQPGLAKMALQYINNSEKIDLKQTG
jgi:hypothetical protein